MNSAAFKLLKEVEGSASKPIDGNTCREVIAENIRMREVLEAAPRPSPGGTGFFIRYFDWFFKERGKALTSGPSGAGSS